MEEKVLGTVTDSDILLGEKDAATYSKKRTAVRAILFDRTRETIAIMHATKEQFHKLPGGGVDPGETIEEALRRECLEEAGCTIAIGAYIGTVFERRKKHDMEQASHTFFAEVEERRTAQLTEKERKEGFVLEWTPLAEAITTIEKETPAGYEGKFIVRRDALFLKEAQRMLAGTAR